MGAQDTLKDTRGRALRDLRISVTDRCNFRCTYCMPKDAFAGDHRFLKRTDLLSFEEIVRCVELLAPLGVRKVRLTGGEPLLRRDLPTLVDALSAFGANGALDDIAMTTNGVLLTKPVARRLIEAGLHRVTVSLDSLDEATFRRIVDVDAKPSDVLAGIDAALAAGLSVKVNTVVKKGVNDADIVPLAHRFHNSGVTLRFIEFMDVGATNRWSSDDVFSAQDIIDRIHPVMPLRPVESAYPGEVAKRWAYRDGGGEIGVIASITQPFCADCTRLRLSADGRLYTCLFATQGRDLRKILRAGDPDEVTRFVTDIWRTRDDRYSELRGRGSAPPVAEQSLKRIEMSYIGG